MEYESSGFDSAETDAERLRQIEEMLRQLAENIREVLFVVTPNPPRMTYVSPSYDEVFGKPSQELYRRADAWINYVDPQDRPPVLSVIEKSMQGVATDVEYRLIRPGGSIRWIHAHTFPVQDSHGKLVRVVTIAEDITDRKSLMGEMAAARAAAEAASRAKSEFLAGLGHEIRTAMNGIVGMTELLLNTDVNPEQAEYLQMVKASAELLLVNIKDRLQPFS